MYDIEGWENNKGSESNWLDDAVNKSEPFNYVPAGYANGAWDTGEHYSYEPGNYYPESQGNDAGSNLPMGYTDMNTMGGQNNNYGSFNQTPWGADVSSTPAGSGARASGGGGGGGGGYGGRSAGFSVSYQNPITYGNLPDVPEYNENKVRGLRQKYAAPGISKLRDAVSEAVTKSMSVDNPYLRKTLMKSSLEGFGGGLENVMTGAESSARNAYDTEYKGKLMGYGSEVNRLDRIFQAAMRGLNVTDGPGGGTVSNNKGVTVGNGNSLADISKSIMRTFRSA